MQEEVIVSAPGKVILHGEHAVVYGKVAVAAGVDLRSFLHLKTNNSGEVRLYLPDVNVESVWKTNELQDLFQEKLCDPLKPEAVGEELTAKLMEFSGVVQDTSNTKHLAVIAFLYLYGSLAWRDGKCMSIDVTVSSSLPVGAGLGSSASFSVCLAAGLLQAAGILTSKVPLHAESSLHCWSETDLELINLWAFQGEKLIHGKPSGIDNSMATYGGALLFKSGKIVKIEKMPKLQVLLTNTKVPRSTKVLVAGVRTLHDKYPEVFGPVLEGMEGVSQRSIDTYSKMVDSVSITEDYDTLEELIDINHNLLRLIGVSHPSLEAVVETSRKYGVHTKLTGAGGGGCALSVLRPGTTEATILEVKAELQSKGFDCWETSVGGNGVVFHPQFDRTLKLPAIFQHHLS